MSIRRCDAGKHTYDDSQFSSCPYCKKTRLPSTARNYTSILKSSLLRVFKLLRKTKVGKTTLTSLTHNVYTPKESMHKRCRTGMHVYSISLYNSCPFCKNQPIDSTKRYVTHKRIGEGSTAVIYSATDTSLNRQVALKVMDSKVYAQHPEYRNIFNVEIAHYSTLEHPNILPMYDSFESETGPVLVLRKCDKTLSDLMSTHGLNNTQVFSILGQIANVIDYLSECQIVHRDIKPSNILIDHTNTHAYLIDFGFTCNFEKINSKHGAVGTTTYMSPEMIALDKNASFIIDDEDLDFSNSDLFSFGILTYLLLSDHLPFDKSTHPKYAKTEWSHSSGLRVLRGETPIPCSDRNPKIPKAASKMIDRMLARSSKDRPSSASDAIAVIQKCYDGKLITGSSIFLSYSHLDTDYAKEVVAGLEREGFEVWWDDLMDHGNIWEDKIEAALIHSDALIAIISSNSVSSNETRHEWRYWLEYKENDPIIPVVVDPKILS